MTRLLLSQSVHWWRSAWCALTAVFGAGAALALLVLLSPVRPVAAAPLVYPGCGPTIQACLNAASNGDSLTIAPGTYITSFTLNKAVSLLGAGPQSVVLHALSGQRVLTVTGAAISNSVVISGLTFTGGNVASATCPKACGGGILITATARPLLRNLVVATNTASYQGGGVYANSGSQVSVQDSQFFNNSAGFQGGGLWSIHESILISNSRFENNHADGTNGSGGGVTNIGGLLTLLNTDFISNSAKDSGGGLVAYQLIATGGQFARNHCLSATCNGGGLVIGGPSSLTGTLLVSNTSNTSGGAIYAGHQLTLTTVNFLTNSADAGCGGAIFMDNNPDEAVVEALWVVDSTFVGNQALSTGGAICTVSRTTISGGRFEANRTITTSAVFGGGAVAIGGNYIDVNGTTFVGNSTAGSGGAMWVNGQARVTNALFLANTGGLGNAVWGYANIQVLHSTIVSLTAASGPAIYITDSGVVRDNIIVNQATGVTVELGGAVVEDYNLFFNVPMLTEGATSGGHSFVDDPNFVNPGGDDFHLAASSPAANAGSNVGVTTDFDGDPRPMGLGYDIGFDELLEPIYTFIPLVLR